MKKTVMKIDKIELKFKKRNGQIQSIEEFSKEFDNGFYFVEHPDVINGTRVVMHVTSNFKNDTFSFDFNRKDIEWGHYWVDKLVQKWTIIWEWFYQADLVTNKSYILGEEDIKKDLVNIVKNIVNYLHLHPIPFLSIWFLRKQVIRK